jgi:acyl-ACP thioesterase
LSDTDIVYETDFTVRSYEIDTTGLVRPLTLFNYMQDAAGEHSARLGLSVLDLFKRNLTWVLSRYTVCFHSFPSVHSRIHLKTWPSGKTGRFALREFQLQDETGAPVISASTSWMLLDLASRRPVRVDTHLGELKFLPDRMVDDSFLSLPELTIPDIELPFRVRHGDVDLNLHVNNVVYVDWALETVPPERIGKLRPASVEISYRAESYYGDRIFSRSGFVIDDSLTSLHTMVSEKTGKEVARLRVRWQEA